MSEDADIRLDQPQASTEGGVEVVGDDEYTKPEASVVTAIRKGIPTPESEPVARLTIMPGRIGREHDSHPGQPMAYFVRTEGTTSTLSMLSGSMEEMLDDLLGPEATDFIVGDSTPEVRLEQAEALRDQLNDPAMQARIREVHVEAKALGQPDDAMQERGKVLDEAVQKLGVELRGY